MRTDTESRNSTIVSWHELSTSTPCGAVLFPEMQNTILGRSDQALLDYYYKSWFKRNTSHSDSSYQELTHIPPMTNVSNYIEMNENSKH